MGVGGAILPPRLERLERLWRDLHSPTFAGATLAGCDVRRSKRGVLVYREWGRGGLPLVTVEAGGSLLWDNRFNVENRASASVTVGALGRTSLPESAGRVRDLPPLRARRTAPALFSGGEPIAAPGLGWQAGGAYAGTVSVRFVELDRRPEARTW